MEDNIAWYDMPIEEHQYSNTYSDDIPAVNNDNIIYISPNNVFWGYLTSSVITQDITNLDKFIKKKFYIIGKNKRGVRKLYEYNKMSDIMYICNDKKMYTIKDNTLVETFSWDYSNNQNSKNSKVNQNSKVNKVNKIYETRIFIYTWMYLDNFYETDKLIDANTGEEMPLPNNIDNLKDIKFYFITNESKNLFKIRKGNNFNYYIANDGNLYMFDENNNLIPGIFRNRLQKWYEVSHIEDI